MPGFRLQIEGTKEALMEMAITLLLMAGLGAMVLAAEWIMLSNR
jgi:hypothetical protein